MTCWPTVRSKGAPQEFSSRPQLLDVYVLTHASLLQESLGLVEAQVKGVLEPTVGNLGQAVLLHEINQFGIAVEVHPVRANPVGKLLPTALYVHRSALEALDPLLRVYEGCARAYLGTVDGANLIKLHRQSGKVSYLVYPDFESDPHPALQRSVRLSLRTREIDCLEYTGSANPPILHRKETFLTADHSLHAKFARLTQQEEKHGLLDDPATIGTKEGWQARLSATGFVLRGHRLVRG